MYHVYSHVIQGNFDRGGLCMYLSEARSRLYRRRFLQVNTRWKAHDEIESFTHVCTFLIPLRLLNPIG